MKINIGNHEFTELWDGVLPIKVKDEVKPADDENLNACYEVNER